jgi:predicted nucleotidyltransferase
MGSLARSHALDIEEAHLRIVQETLGRLLHDGHAWVFGSRARGNAKPHSDLDIAVSGKVPGTPLPMDVQAALADGFSDSDLPFKVDVVDLATVRPSFREIIERHKVALHF